MELSKRKNRVLCRMPVFVVGRNTTLACVLVEKSELLVRQVVGGREGMPAHGLTHQPFASTSLVCASDSPSPDQTYIATTTRDAAMAGTPGPIKRAWYQWKMQRFPWRKRWLVGE